MSTTKLTISKQAQRQLQAQYRHDWIEGEQNGEAWTTDSYSAIKFDLPQPTAKVFQRSYHKINMLSVIPDLADYTAAERTEANQDDPAYTDIYAGNTMERVNTKYLANMTKALPHARLSINTGRKYAPLAFDIDGEVVGLLSPVRQ